MEDYTKYPKGSEWRKWDLHVHTPNSICQHYGEDNEETWKKFITELEKLSDENFGVIGINDYLFLDGYKKLVQEQGTNTKLARLKLFPVVEFRIEKFAGVDFKKFKRINLHVIFSDELDIDTIESQFLNTLSQSYTLDSGDKWTRHITRDSVSELGKKIKESVPDGERSNYGSDIDEGFNNLNVDEKQIFESLKKDCFEGKYLIAIGKTEWDELKWSDASIATKKTIINDADIVFTAAETIQNYTKAKEQLKSQGVKDLLFDCSDAHYFSDSQNKDRIGNCNTWIKADPTFKGLKQILIEPEERLFIGEKPPSISRVENNPTKYINKVFIEKNTDSSLDEIWFDEMPELQLNSGLVAIIGNKGNGKSALADIIGLAGNTHNSDAFSFLNKTKFRKPRPNRSESFFTNILWHSTVHGERIQLSSDTNKSIPEKVKYIPQSFLEELCTETDEKQFSEELKGVIFSHVDESDRLGKSSIDELIEFKSEAIGRLIQTLRNELMEVNSQLVELENKNTTEYRSQIESSLKIKEEEYDAHKENKPKVVTEPVKDENVKKKQKEISEQLSKLKAERTDIEEKILGKREERKKLALKLTRLQNFNQAITNFKGQYTQLQEQYEQELGIYDIKFEEVVNLSIKDAIVGQVINGTSSDIKAIDEALDESIDNSLANQLSKKKAKILQLQGQLDEPTRKYQEYQDNIKKWSDREKELLGSAEKQDSINYFKAIINWLEKDINDEIVSLKTKRKEKVKSIYNEKAKIVELYKELYKPVTKFIMDYGELMQNYSINLDVSIQLSDFSNKFFNYVSRGAKGSFIGSDEGIKVLNQLTDGVNFDSKDEMLSFLDSILEYLLIDQRSDKKEERRISEQLRQDFEVKDFYDFLFSLDYLEPNYKLKLGNKNIAELSPGERGALLLIFYLLLDKQEIPLVIDQPEENLDNESVYNILVTFIKEAKKKRQVIIVTHNPNLAVVCDAEQIISVKIEKENKNKLSFISGAIENPEINQEIVRILEGTFPAFDNRTEKYKVSKL